MDWCAANIPTDDFRENLKFRADMQRQADSSSEVRSALRDACEAEFAFFTNAFCWGYDPRPRKDEKGKLLPKRMPFILRPHQAKAMEEINGVLGFEDVGIEKARGEGGSWMFLLNALHWWRWRDGTVISLVSRNKEAADKSDDPNSLMWKLDWELKQLERCDWLIGRKGKHYSRSISKSCLIYLPTNSIIVAYAATGEVGSGGRSDWFLMDELSKFPRGEDYAAVIATQGNTNSRVFIATPYGRAGAYYDLMHTPSNMKKIVLDWRDNPERNRGLYVLRDGRPEALDPDNPLPPAYANFTQEVKNLFDRLRRKGFVLEGKSRSPWFDKECDRPGATPQSIAQEFERDYGGSVVPIFSNDFHERVEESAKPPLIEGIFRVTHTEAESCDGYKYGFERAVGGLLKLWCELDAGNRPPVGKYIIAADVASGQGGGYTSNSAAVIFNADTGDQVGALASNSIPPNEFADLCMAMGRFFHRAYLAWEHGGPGTAFTRRVKEKRYGYCFQRTVLTKGFGVEKSKELGFVMNEKTKEVLFADMGTGVCEGAFIVRDQDLAREFTQYIRGEDGGIVHVAYRQKTAPGAGKSHGDRVIAFGVMVHASRDIPRRGFSQASEDDGWEALLSAADPPPGTAAERFKPLFEQLYGRSRQDEPDFPTTAMIVRGGDSEREYEGW